MLQPKSGLALALAMTLALATTACRNEAPADPGVTPQASTQAQATPGAEPEAGISVEPLALADCNGSVVTVRWNLRQEHPDLLASEVLTLDAQGALTMFAAGAQGGEARTGPWATPGSTFVVRDRATGMELDRVVVGGPDCAQ